jgi:LmbE family N-acetylglucosaminyl deacetylase
MDPRPFDRDHAHVFISPHLDDVAMSCAGRVLHLVRHASQVTVLTVFAGDPPPGKLSPHAEWFHAICGLDVNPVGARRAEDLHAMRILGAQPVHLSLPDHMYRPSKVRAPVRPGVGATPAGRRADEHLVAVIVAELHAMAGHAIIGSIHAPLGIGRHIDHVTARVAAETFIRESLPARRPRLLYYEELPNAARDDDPTWGYELVLGMEPEVHPLCDDDWHRKLDAIHAYQSQMPVLRGPVDDLDDELRTYAQDIGNGRFTERIWRPDSRGW